MKRFLSALIAILLFMPAMAYSAGGQGGGGQSQTPWVGNVNGGDYNLTNVASVALPVLPATYSGQTSGAPLLLGGQLGTSGTPSTSVQSPFIIEKYSAANTGSTYEDGTGWFILNKNGGISYSVSLTSFLDVVNPGVNGGSSVAFHSKAVNEAGWSTYTGTGIWAGWFNTLDLQTSKVTYDIGIETDIFLAASKTHNVGTVDLTGAYGYMVDNQSDQVNTGNWHGTAGYALAFEANGTYSTKWYTGWFNQTDSIVPGDTDEVYQINGSASSGNAYAGLRFNGYLTKGLDFSNATFGIASIYGNIGIDTPPTANTPLTINSSSALAAGLPSMVLQGSNNTERFAIESTNGGATFEAMTGYGGTLTYPGQMSTGISLGSYQFGGYNGGASPPWVYNSATIRAYPLNNWTSVGGITTYSVGSAGNGYNIGDIVFLTGGNNNAYLSVATLTGGAGTGIATFNTQGLSRGSGYSATTYNTTTTGGGLGATVTVSAVAATADQSSYLAFYTTPSGTTSQTEKMRIFASGCLSINNMTDCGTGNLSVTGQPYFQQSSPPTVSCNAGSPSAVTGTNSNGHFQVGTAAVNCTVTFVPAWPTAIYGCVVSANTSTALPYIDASTPPSTTAFKVDFVTTGTPIIYYHCAGD